MVEVLVVVEVEVVLVLVVVVVVVVQFLGYLKNAKKHDFGYPKNGTFGAQNKNLTSGVFHLEEDVLPAGPQHTGGDRWGHLLFLLGWSC